MGRLIVPRGGAGCVQSPSRGLVHGRSRADRARGGRAEHGHLESSTPTRGSYITRIAAASTRARPSGGDAYDNALAESFFATLETELLTRQSFPHRGGARLAIFDYLEGIYNPRRRHSALGQVAPAEFEKEVGEPNPKPGILTVHPPRNRGNSTL